MFQPRSACPACGGGGSLIFETSYRALSPFLSDYYGCPIALDGPYSIRLCGRCGTYYQGEVGTPELLATVYGEWLDGPDNQVNLRDIGEIRLASAFLKRRVMRTLDYGMGRGSWALAAKGLGHSSHGFDYSDELMAKAAAAGIRTEASSGFDFINTEQVFEHLVEPRATARELAGRLAPGGVLKICVPSQRTTARVVKRLQSGEPMGRWNMALRPLEHLQNFSRRGLRILAAEVGLTPVTPALALEYRTTGRTPKELLRPLYRRWGRAKTYMWFRKAL